MMNLKGMTVKSVVVAENHVIFEFESGEKIKVRPVGRGNIAVLKLRDEERREVVTVEEELSLSAA